MFRSERRAAPCKGLMVIRFTCVTYQLYTYRPQIDLGIQRECESCDSLAIEKFDCSRRSRPTPISASSAGNQRLREQDGAKQVYSKVYPARSLNHVSLGPSAQTCMADTSPRADIADHYGTVIWLPLASI